MTIRYLYKEGSEACESEPLQVSIDGRLAGEIRKVTGGYQYFPKGIKKGGRVFNKIGEVQRSLSEEG